MPAVRPEIKDQLARHGVRLLPTTPLEFARTFVRDLYNYELRRQRDLVRSGVLSKAELVEEVHALRRKYWVLSVPIGDWHA